MGSILGVHGTVLLIDLASHGKPWYHVANCRGRQAVVIRRPFILVL